MKIRDPRSIMIILSYVLGNALIIVLSLRSPGPESEADGPGNAMAPDNTIIESLEYFNLKEGVPHMSLTAEKMNSLGESFAEFVAPKGVYNYQQNKESLRYKAQAGTYMKDQDLLRLTTEVELTSVDGDYYADKVDYHMMKDLVLGSGGVRFIGDDPKSKDRLEIEAPAMSAHPSLKTAVFSGGAKGSMARKKKHEGKMDFRSKDLYLDGISSLAQLVGDAWIKRGGHQITAGKADIFLENYNKSLKYFVLNDDVKVIENLMTPQGITERRAFSERLEGFGRDQKMILSGAPRVEQEADVIKGYRIIIRENVDLVEVDDAMSDVKVKRNDKQKLKE